MAHPIDWLHVLTFSCAGRLMELLLELPHARWSEHHPDGTTFLHYSCYGSNVGAVVALIAHGLDVGAREDEGWVPAHFAVHMAQARMLELLCAAGSPLRAVSQQGDAPLDMALRQQPRCDPCARVLLANGVRLSSVQAHRRRFIPRHLEAFEHGVLQCRSVVVALLRVKQAGRLVAWDKFLLRQVALDVWATRGAEDWHVKKKK